MKEQIRIITGNKNKKNKRTLELQNKTRTIKTIQMLWQIKT